MLEAYVTSRMTIGPARNITDIVDAGNAGFEMSVHSNAAVELKSGLLGQCQSGTDANPNDDQVRLQRDAALQHGTFAIDRDQGLAEMEYHAVFLMEATHEIAHVRAEDTLHWACFRRHDMNLDTTVTQGSRGLEPNEACTDDDRALC